MKTGKITLLDLSGVECRVLKYDNRLHRNQIIDKWKKTYGKTPFLISITPDIPERKTTT